MGDWYGTERRRRDVSLKYLPSRLALPAVMVGLLDENLLDDIILGLS